MEGTLGLTRRPVVARRCVGRLLLSRCAHRRVRLPIDASGSNSWSREEDARCHLVNLQASRRRVGRQIRPHSSGPLATGSRSSSSQGTLCRRVRRPASSLVVAVRMLVTAEIVASWSSSSKQLIVQQVVASRGRSASHQKTRQLAWCSVRRLIVVVSGGRLWVYQAASRHVRKPLVASFHQEGAVIVLRSSSLVKFAALVERRAFR